MSRRIPVRPQRRQLVFGHNVPSLPAPSALLDLSSGKVALASWRKSCDRLLRARLGQTVAHTCILPVGMALFGR